MTVDPTISINNETASYSGTVPTGETVALDVSSTWIEEGTNTVDLDFADANGGPKPSAELSYQHSAETSGSASISSTTWSEDVELSRSFSSAQENVSASIPLPDNVQRIESVEIRRDGGSWSSLDDSRMSWDSDQGLVVDVGSVVANESIDLRAMTSKIRIPTGDIEVLDPTTEGAALGTRMRVLDDGGSDPLEIDIGETVVGDRVHIVESADWDARELHISRSDGSETLRLPNAATGLNATIGTAPLSINPETGDVETRIERINGSDEELIRFRLTPGSTSGDLIELSYLDTVSGEHYELVSVSEDRIVDRDTATSPAIFSLDDRDGTYLIRIGDPPGGSTLIGAPVDDSGSGWLPLVLSILGVGVVGIGASRMGMSWKIAIPVAGVAAFGLAELSSPSSILATISADLLLGSGPAIMSIVGGATILVGLAIADRRDWIDVGALGYLLAIVVAILWIGTSILPDPTALIAVVGGATILVGLAVADRRLGLPRWISAIVGIGALLWIVATVAPQLLDGIASAIGSGLAEIAPLAILGLIALAIYGIRRWTSRDEVVLNLRE